MRILLVAPSDPGAPNRIRTSNIAAALEMLGHQVSILYWNREGGRPSNGRIPARSHVSASLARSAVALLQGRSMRAAYVSSYSLRREVAKRSSDADLVIFKRKRTGHLAQYVDARVPCILDLTDSVGLWQSRVAALEALTFRQRTVNNLDLPGTIREEVSLAKTTRFRQLWLCSQEDLDYLRILAGSPLDHACLIPNIPGPKWLESGPALGPEPDRYVSFHADFRQPTNWDAGVWLLRDLWPSASWGEPKLRLIVAGHGSERLPIRRDNENVVRAGFVSDVVELVRGATATIVPLRAGAGTKNKIMESLCVGVPCVSTPMGSAGLPSISTRGSLLPFSDATSLARALRAVATSVSDRTEIQASALELFGRNSLLIRLEDAINAAWADS